MYTNKDKLTLVADPSAYEAKFKLIHIKENDAECFTSYIVAHDDNESDYEDNEKNHYSFEKKLGEGSSAQARQFSTKDNTNKKIVVLSPSKKNFFWSYKEIITKVNFFNSIYPDLPQAYFESTKKGSKPTTYRLILPLIPGLAYNKLTLDNDLLLQVMLSTVQALKNCHQKGYAFIDLKADNILYDKPSRTSYLIDGGTSVKLDAALPDMFQFTSQEQYRTLMTAHSHMAPECWSMRPNSAYAQAAMDVYSIGKMFMKMLDKQYILQQDILSLLNNCLKENPIERITIDQLELQLLNIIYSSHQQKEPKDVNPINVGYQSQQIMDSTPPTPILDIASLSSLTRKLLPTPTITLSPTNESSSEESSSIVLGKRKRQESLIQQNKKNKPEKITSTNFGFFPLAQIVYTDEIDEKKVPIDQI